MNTENEHTGIFKDENFISDVKRTLLYYEVFHYPLTPMQLFTFLPTNSLTFNDFTPKYRKMFFLPVLMRKRDFFAWAMLMILNSDW